MGDKRYWLGAAVIVAALLGLLAVQPDAARAPTGTAPAAAARIVELPAADAPDVATVELSPRERTESATALAARFAAERADPTANPHAAAEVTRALAPLIDAGRATLELECRQTVCRATLAARSAAERPTVVAAATTALHAAGYETLLARADGPAASLFIGVRTPQTP